MFPLPSVVMAPLSKLDEVPNSTASPIVLRVPAVKLLSVKTLFSASTANVPLFTPLTRLMLLASVTECPPMSRSAVAGLVTMVAGYLDTAAELESTVSWLHVFPSIHAVRALTVPSTTKTRIPPELKIMPDAKSNERVHAAVAATQTPF